jgi:toxin ParE1/3/4
VKPVVHSAQAIIDVRDTVAYYHREVDRHLADDFINELESAIQQIRLWPGSGSHRFSELLDISGLQTYSLKKFPYLIFYIEHPGHTAVWRILHMSRDIPLTLQDDSLSSDSNITSDDST